MFGPVEALMAVGPVLGYADQYRLFHRDRSSAGFPLAICAILLLSSILRIVFWLGKRFDAVLLVQSCLMVVAQLALLHAAVRYRDAEAMALARSSPAFWRWGTYARYVQFLGVFALGMCALHGLLWWSSTFVEGVGVMALAMEALLPLPQVAENARRRSTRGFSGIVLGAWVCGDAFKTLYYVHHDAPLQFTLCGLFQLAMDAVLVGQLWLYRGRSSRLLD